MTVLSSAAAALVVATPWLLPGLTVLCAVVVPAALAALWTLPRSGTATGPAEGRARGGAGSVAARVR